MAIRPSLCHASDTSQKVAAGTHAEHGVPHTEQNREGTRPRLAFFKVLNYFLDILFYEKNQKTCILVIFFCIFKFLMPKIAENRRNMRVSAILRIKAILKLGHEQQNPAIFFLAFNIDWTFLIGLLAVSKF